MCVCLREQIVCRSPLHWPHCWLLLCDPRVFCHLTLVKERKNEKKKRYLHHVINIAAPVQSSGEKLVVDPFNLKFLVVCNGLDCPPSPPVPLQLTLAFLPPYLYLSLCLYPFIFGYLSPICQSRQPPCRVGVCLVFLPNGEFFVASVASCLPWTDQLSSTRLWMWCIA